jgi:hypothetical protein
MDNTGGHGTEDAIKEYTEILQKQFNITIIHQIPRSPETNTLDLGIWCCLQWAVDYIMKGRRGDVYALHQGVMEVWEKSKLEGAFNNVWNRLTRVLKLIKMDNGGNKQVEQKRGKKWCQLDEPLQDEEAEQLADTMTVTATATNATFEEPEYIDLVEEDDVDEFEENDDNGACFLV